MIRKWTCTRDLKKARQADYQKIQRKYRKEKKDIEKFTSTISELEAQIAPVSRAANNILPTGSNGNTVMETAGDGTVQESPALSFVEQTAESVTAKASSPSTGETENPVVSAAETPCVTTLPIAADVTGDAADSAVNLAGSTQTDHTSITVHAVAASSKSDQPMATSNDDVGRSSPAPVQKDNDDSKIESEGEK